MKRITAILTIASTVVCCLAVVLFAVSFDLVLADVDARSGDLAAHDSIAVTLHFRCGVSEGSAWFFSHDYPYTGSLRFLSDDHGGVFYKGGGHARVSIDRSWSAIGGAVGQVRYVGDQGDIVGRDLFADLPGVYYRHFAGMNEPLPLWTFRVSLWYPMLLSALLPALWVRRRVRSSATHPWRWFWARP